MPWSITMKNTSGYTILELMVVVLIISVLSVSGFMLYSSTRQRSHDAVRANDILAIRSSLEQYYAEMSRYPKPADFSASILETFFTTVTLPKDPMNAKADKDTQFYYVYAAAHGEKDDSTGQEYELSANYEITDANVKRNKELTDNGNDLTRWETGSNTNFVHTDLPSTGEVCLGANDYTAGDDGEGACVVIDKYQN